MKQLLAISVVGVVLWSMGCSRLVVRNDGLQNTVVMNRLKGAEKHFIQEHVNEYWLWGLIAPEVPYLSKLIRPHVSKGEKVSNLQLRQEVKGHQFILCFLTVAIYCPQTLAVEADIL